MQPVRSTITVNMTLQTDSDEGFTHGEVSEYCSRVGAFIFNKGIGRFAPDEDPEIIDISTGEKAHYADEPTLATYFCIATYLD